MNSPLKIFTNWLMASLPLHLIMLLVVAFGNTILSNDINTLLLLYIVSLMSTVFLHATVAVSEKNNKIFIYTFVALLLLNTIASVTIPYLSFVNRIRPLLLFLMGIATYPILLKARNETLYDNKQLQPLSISKSVSYIAIFLIFILAFGLRVYHLDSLPSYRDEDHHIQAVWQMLNEQCFDYKRGLIVTYLGAFFIKITGSVSYDDYVFWGRFPSAIVGSLVVLPIFLLGRKIAVLTGIVSAFLWAISPWAIGISQNFREHIYFVFFITLMVYLLIQCLDWMFKFKRENLPKIISSGLVIALILLYAIALDWFSTLKISGVILSVITLAYIVTNLYNIEKINPKFKKYLPWVAVLAGLFFIPITQIKFFKMVDSPNVRWADSFLSANAQMPTHWWNNVSADAYLVYFVLFLAVTSVLFFKNRSYWWIYFITFFSLLIGYTYFFDRFYAPRYIVFIYPFFILLITAGFTGVFQILRILNQQISPKKWISYSLLTLQMVLLAFFIKPQNTLMAVTQPTILENNATTTTGVVHDDKNVAINFLKSIPGEVRMRKPIITSIYGESLRHEVDSLGPIDKYQYDDPNRKTVVAEIMKKNRNGYLILDRMRNGTWAEGYPLTPKKPFYVGDTKVSFLKEENLCQIYEWSTTVETDQSNWGILDSMLVDTGNELDINGPFVLKVMIQHNEKINAPALIIGNSKDNGISFVPTLNEKGIIINYGADYDDEIFEILLTPNQWNTLELYQYGGTKGSAYGIILNDVKIFESKVPQHKSGVHKIYTNTVFDGNVFGIDIEKRIDKKRY